VYHLVERLKQSQNMQKSKKAACTTYDLIIPRGRHVNVHSHVYIFRNSYFFRRKYYRSFSYCAFYSFFYGTMPDLLRGEKTLCDFNYIMIDSY
jgi:hypothetical protein